MDEENLVLLIGHIFAHAPVRQAVAALTELQKLLAREGADEALVRITEKSIKSASELHSLAVAGRPLSREELTAAFIRAEELV